MSALNLQTCKENILEKLRAAGAAGLVKTKLVSSTPKSRPQEALKELEKDGLIANLGDNKKYLYVLKAYDTPRENACGKIEAYFGSRQKALFSRSKLLRECQKGLPAKVKKELGRALDGLVRENKLLKFKYGRYDLFLHASAIPAALCHPVPVSPGPLGPDRDSVFQAYRKVRQRLGFSNVEIYQLQQELNIDMDVLKAFLLEESRQGRAVLSLGDWSLSTAAARRGAIELQGRQYLLIRFKSEESKP